MISVACGSRHSGAVCSDGSLYCWGDSREGQCGAGVKSSPITTPAEVKVIESLNVCNHGVASQQARVKMKTIACGELHTLALSEKSELWGWGSTAQVGVVSNNGVATPQKVSFLAGRKVLGVDCGSRHSIALVQTLSHGEQKRLNAEKNAQSSQSSSRSGSPVRNNVQIHRVLPSTCVKCNSEIYTYTETNDTCIISDDHHCPLGLEVTEEAKKHDHGADEKQKETESSQVDTQIGSEEKARGNVIDKEKDVTENKSDKSDTDAIPANQVDMACPAGKTCDNETDPASPETSLNKQSKIEGSVESNDLAEGKDNGDKKVSEELAMEKRSDLKEQVISKRAKHKPPDISIPNSSTQDASQADPEKVTASGQGAKRSRNPSTKSEGGSLQRSRSSFLDESEAKMYLQKQMCFDEGEDVDKKPPLSTVPSQSSMDPPESPFRKQVENFMNLVPNSTTMLQGMSNLSNLTSKVVTNIKTSIDKSMFGYVSSQSIDYDSLSKSSSFDSLTPPNDRTPTDGSQRVIKGDESPKKSRSNVSSRKTSLIPGGSVESEKGMGFNM